MNFNKVIIMGNLTKDPELRYLPSGAPVANFSIAVNDRYKKGEETVENVSFFDIVVFSKQAENCNQYLSKGRPVLVEGRLQQRRWDDKNDGSKRSKIEIIATSVIFLGGNKGGGGVNSAEEGGADYQPVNDNDIPF